MVRGIIGMSNSNLSVVLDAPHHLPNRRQRLQTFMRLKSQRQMLLAGLTLLALVCAALLALMMHEHSRTHSVALGKGVASVETMPVSDLQAFAISGPEPAPVPSPSESGMGAGDASFYGHELAGNRTASGEAFNPDRLTAAHRTLPLGSRVRVTNPRTGKSVIVRINDRGPFHRNRVIDLSLAAARQIGLIRTGSGRVSLSLLV